MSKYVDQRDGINQPIKTACSTTIKQNIVLLKKSSKENSFDKEYKILEMCKISVFTLAYLLFSNHMYL